MSTSGAELLRQVKSQIQEIDPSEVKELAHEGVTIIDVRGSEEFATGHLPGAKSVPRGHLESRIEGVVPDRSSQVILYCASGQRSAYAARTLKLAVRGVIENMSWFTGDDGTRYELFGRGGGEALAAELEVALLGRIPLVPAVREGADAGVPVHVADADGEAARAFDDLARRLEDMGPARIYRRELSVR